jgi:riboflavin synthase
MFTGIVQQCGVVDSVEHGGGGARLRIRCELGELELGESIAVDGVCLTVARHRPGGGFEADASQETRERTTLGERRGGDRVHLERALRVQDRLGGHVVTGHVDGVGWLVRREPLGEAQRVVFEIPGPLAGFVAPKGSVAVQGVSLTVNEVSGRQFAVVLVPHTLRETTFGTHPSGGRVNVEADVLAKYVARLLGRPGVDGTGGSGSSPDEDTLDLLRRQGYV